MNKVYKVVWNASLGVFVAVSELASARGKSSSTTNNAASSADKKAGIFKPVKTALVLSMLFVLPHSVMAAENVDANNLTVAGTSTFTGAATFNGGITANSITVGGKAVATSDQITNLETNKADKTAVDALSNQKADKTAVDALEANKADKTAVDALSNQKADKTAVDALSNRVTTLVLTDEYTGIKYFRVKSTEADAKAKATDSVAIGPKAYTETSATKGIAIGNAAQAGSKTSGEVTYDGAGSFMIGDGESSLAIGDSAAARGNQNIAIGKSALTTNKDAAGQLSSNNIAIGTETKTIAASNAIALGNQAVAGAKGAVADSAIAIGDNAKSTSESTVAIGKGAQALPWRTISIGQDAGKNQKSDVSGDKNEHINIGVNAGQNIDGQLNISIGQSAGSDTQGKGNIALGQNAGRFVGGNNSSVGNNIAIGTNANRFSAINDVQEVIAIGFGATAEGSRSVALGKDAKTKKVDAVDSVAIGASSQANGASSVAIGLNANVNGADNVALGAKSVADTKAGTGYLTGKPSNTVVSVGNDTLQRRIVNVADGADDQDAVTIAQLKRTSDDVFSKVNAAINNIPANSGSGINYDTTTRPGEANSITLKKDTVIGNVAPGVLDTDAVNVAQLNQTVEANKIRYFSTKVNGATRGNVNNDGAEGDISLAIGMDVRSTGYRSVTVGNASTAESKGGIAIGSLYDGSDALDDKDTQKAIQTVAKSSTGQPFNYNMAIGAGATSEGNNSIAIGSLAQTTTKQQQNTSPDRAIAIGYFARASEVKANAIGDRATSSGLMANAFGSQATSTAESSTAIGTVAQAGGVNSIAMGTHQRVTGANSGSIGYAGVFTPTNVGREISGTHNPNATQVSGSGTYSVGNTNSTVTSNESGIFGNDNVIQAKENVRVVGNKNTVSNQGSAANSPTAVTPTLKDVYITGHNNQVDGAAKLKDSKNLFVMGAANKVGTKDEALTITDSYVIGTNNTINTSNTASDSNDPSNPGAKVGKGFFILGNNVTATKENSVYLGTDAAYTAKGASTDGDAAVTEPVTVGGTLTYGGFAGKTPVGVVTVGDVGKERRIQNVAAGLISATSTDAINGSQLYATNAKLGNVANTVKENFGGNATLNPDGSITYTNIGNTGKDNIHDAIKAATTKVEEGAGIKVDPTKNADGSTTYTVSAKTDGTTTKIDDKGNIAAVTAPLTTNTDGKVNTPAAPNALATAGDIANAINNSGWKLAADGTTGTELINPSDTVTFKTGSSNLTVKRDGANITYDLAKDININSVKFGDNGPTIKADASNNINIAKSDGSPTKITNVKAGEADTDAVNVSQLEKAQAAATTKVEGDKGVSVTPKTNTDGSTTYTVAAKTDGITTTIDGKGNIAAVTAPLTTNTDGKVNTPAAPNALATAGDIANAINNSGWKLAADGTTGTELINPSDTVTFKTGSSNLTVKRDGANITYDLAKDININSVKFGDNGPTIKADASNNINIAKSDGSPTKITNVKAGEADTDAVNVSQLEKAQAAATTKVEGDKGVSVTPKTNTDGSTTYTVAAKTDGTTTKIDDKGNIAAVTAPLTTNTDGKVNTPAAPNALATAGDIANAINNSGWKLAADGTTGTELINPSDTVTFKTGSSNLTVKRDGANITYDLAKDININSVKFGDNGPTIKADASNNINIAKSDGSPTKITNVKAGEADTDAVNVSQLEKAQAAATTKVEGDKGVSVTPKTNTDGSTTYTVAAKTDGITTTIDGKGNIAAVTAPLTTNTDGKVNTPAAPNALATAGDIANAINNSGWKLAADGTTGTELINPSDTVTFKTGSSNLTVKRDGANITYDLAKDININSVKFGDNGPTIKADASNNINIAKSDGSPTKITNVKAGEADTDAVNVSQLEKAQAAATTKVEGDKGVSVTPKTNTDGSTTYTVAAKTDGITTTIDGKGNIAAVTTTYAPTTDGKVGAPVGNGDSLVTANTVADAINNSGWKATSGATGSGVVNGTTEELINPSETVTFQAGDNMVLNQAGNVFTYSLNKDININSVQFNDGPKITNDGDNIKVGDKDGNATKITNVKAGEADTDAVNVSQLKEAANNLVTTGFNIADGKGGKDNVKLGETVTFTDPAGNIITTVTDNKVEFGLNSTLSVGKAGEPGKVGIKGADGKDAISLNGEDGTIGLKGADGKDGISLNGKDGTIGINGKDGANATLTVEKAKPALDGKDGQNGEDGQTRIVYTKPNGSKEEVATLNDGLNFKADDGSIVAKKLNETLEIVGGADKDSLTDNNIGVNNKDGKLTVQLAKDLKGIDSITVNNGPVISGNGIDMNGDKITNVKAGTEDNDAVNVSQLKAVEATANKGWNLTTNGKAESKSNVKPGDTVDFNNTDGNVKIKNTGNNVTVNLNKDIDLTKDGSVTIGDTKVNNDGLTIVGGPSVTKSGIDAGDKKITNVADGVISATSKDAVNGSQLYQAVNNINTSIAASKEEVKSADGSVTVTTTQNAKGANVYDLSVNTDGTTIKKNADGSLAVNTTPLTNNADGTVKTPTAPNAIATAGDIANAINNSGFTLTAQGSNGSLVKPGATVDMNNTDGNIVISKSASNNNVTYNLAKNVKVDSVTAGDTVMGTDGITINNGSVNGNTVSLTKDGLNNGGNRITNVAPGVNGTDAVNMNQLKDFGYNLGNKIDKVGDEANAGVSSAMAMAALPQAYIPGKSMATGGMATYNGQGAVAVGISKLSDNGRWVLKISGSADTQGNAGGAVGAGFHF